MVIQNPTLLQALADEAQQDPRLLQEVLRSVTGPEPAQLEALAKASVLPLERGYAIWSAGLGLPFHALDERSLDPRILHRIPLDVARRYGAIAVTEEDGMLCVVLRNPFDILALDTIQEVTGMPVQVMVSTPAAIDKALERIERGRTGIEGLIARIQQADIDLATVSDADKLRRVVGDDAVIQIVDYMVDEALRAGASDIHVEPQRTGLRIRVRIDGNLDLLQELPAGLHRAVVSRIKVLAGMDIGESRKPQDGRFAKSDTVEMRCSVLPSVLGEKAVMRVLNRGNIDLSPDRLLMGRNNLALFRKGYSAPNGMVLLTGPTGSGKTTTLYTAMAELNVPDCNLITVEDPVEYEMAGTTQVQVDVKADRTFANALRSILRQDPDVVMVGEIRDAETAAIAVQAALTGHMVLSTLHTNDALAAVHRLIDMGIVPYLLAPALRCIVGQRLVPRVCTQCAVPVEPTAQMLAAFELATDTELPGLMRGTGCHACRNKGKKGRVAIHEVLYVTHEIADMISRGAPQDELKRAARAAGYRPLLLDGLDKAMQGLITLEDVVATARAE